MAREKGKVRHVNGTSRLSRNLGRGRCEIGADSDLVYEAGCDDLFEGGYLLFRGHANLRVVNSSAGGIFGYEAGADAGDDVEELMVELGDVFEGFGTETE